MKQANAYSRPSFPTRSRLTRILAWCDRRPHIQCQWWANQWQLILSGFAYTLLDRLRVHLKNTPFERMSAGTLRLKLIKVGAVIIRNTRRIRVLMSDSYPYKKDLSALVQRLVPS